MSDLLTRRMGVFAELAINSQGAFGRTALMKLCYFLQEVKDVPLHYDFSLYTYGPFDSEVLADLQTAEQLKILETEFEQYPGGYGYQIGPGPLAQRVVKQAADFLDEHRDVIEWFADFVASKRPSELELASTIVFVSKEKSNVSDDALVSLVRAVKPNFSIAEVKKQIEWLRTNKLLEAQGAVHS
jgi:uncharacterized protein YwgA